MRTDVLLQVVSEHPGGITSVQVASLLGADQNQVSYTLSRLALYGRLDRRQMSNKRMFEYFPKATQRSASQ